MQVGKGEVPAPAILVVELKAKPLALPFGAEPADLALLGLETGCDEIAEQVTGARQPAFGVVHGKQVFKRNGWPAAVTAVSFGPAFTAMRVSLAAGLELV